MQIDLKWMLAAWVRLGPEVEEKRPAEEEEKEEAEAPEAEVEEGRRQNYGRVVATYEVPVTKGLQTTTVTLKQEQLIKLWKRSFLLVLAIAIFTYDSDVNLAYTTRGRLSQRTWK